MTKFEALYAELVRFEPERILVAPDGRIIKFIEQPPQHTKRPWINVATGDYL